MANNTRRRRHRVLALVAAGAVCLVVALGLVLMVVMQRATRPPEQPLPSPPTAQPPTTSAGPKKPRPEFQDASCPDVQVLSIPGTWESSPQQDPLNPAQFPNALLLNVTRPLAEQFGNGRLQVYTVPYIAQFHLPLSGDNEVDYDVSRRNGTDATRRAMADMAQKCPKTNYVIVGISQGAVIGGDIASDIGNGRGPVAADRVLGVTLISDGRRQPGVGRSV